MKEINNDIKESYCSFEVSRLLNEKGFLVNTGYCYKYESGKPYNQNSVIIVCGDWNDISGVVMYITNALAIEWIRVNFGIFIVVGISSVRPFGFHYYIQNDRGNEICNSILGNYKTPQEATEEALKYVLQNLISK